MSKKKTLFLEFLTKVGLKEDQAEVVEYMATAFPKKREKVIQHDCLFFDDLDEEEVAEFLECPEEWLSEAELPSFSFDKGSLPEAEEGEEFYVRVNGKYYSMTLHEGECIEASWDGTIYTTEIRDFQEIPEEEYEKYNFVEYTFMSRWK